MRNISSEALAKLQTNKGTEPISIISIKWDKKEVFYADRDVAGIQGKILSIGEMEHVIDVSGNSTSQEIEIVLSDVDGSLKELMDTQDIHQKTAKVYQYFNGLDLSDKFLVFSGKVSSPIIWSEGDRTLTFSIVSQIEDKEFGFSAEEGQFPFIPKDLVGKPWPVIFGKCLDVPALRVNQAVTGTTLCGIGIVSGKKFHVEAPLGGDDCGLGMSLAVMQEHINFLNACAAAYGTIGSEKAAELRQQANDLRASMAQAAGNQANQINCANVKRIKKIDEAEEKGLGCNPVRILGGEDFPQDKPITLNINGGLFTGIMRDDKFHISTRRHPDNEEKAEKAFGSIASNECETPTPSQKFDFQMNVPPGTGDTLNRNQIRRHGFIICTQPQTVGLPNVTTKQTVGRPNVNQVAQHFWADAGSRVVLHGDEPITYIVSITPGKVLAVKAYKTLNNVRRLVNVPNELWSVESKQYGSITAVQLTTKKPLSSIPDQGWEDDIYVTFESTIGPDTIEILEWIIENYTDLNWDEESFEATREHLERFPSNFPVLDRRNTVELLQKIAYDCRCALWIKDEKFYIKYLPIEPDVDQAVTVSDIDSTSLQIELTSTEDLVTNMNVTWWLSHAAEEPEKIPLRHNVKKYGTKQEDVEWLIYNQPDIIHKVATFWLIRKSHTWKKVTFTGGLNLLRLEAYDTITIPYVADAPVKAVVQQADYDSESNTVTVTCLTPVQAGTKTVDPFFWPAGLPASVTFPPKDDIKKGYAGGDGIGANAKGNLPIGKVTGVTEGGTVFVGGPNVLFKSNADYGDPRPTDQGFVAQEIVPENVFADLDITPNPNPDLTLNYVDPLPAIPNNTEPDGEIFIDIRTTRITDRHNPNATAHLDSIIREITREGNANKLAIDTDALISDGTNKKAFDFKYDDEGEKFGAGTAFLKDEDGDGDA